MTYISTSRFEFSQVHAPKIHTKPTQAVHHIAPAIETIKMCVRRLRFERVLTSISSSLLNFFNNQENVEEESIWKNKRELFLL